MDALDLQILHAIYALWMLLLALAAIYDAWKFIIPNTISVTLAVLFFPSAFLIGLDVDWLSHLGAAILIFVAGVAAYRFNILGAGDAKLLTAIGLWVGFGNPLLLYVLFVALGGGALAILLIVVRRLTLSLLVYLPVPDQVTLPRILVTNEKVPYGIAIVAGAVIIGRSPSEFGQLIGVSI